MITAVLFGRVVSAGTTESEHRLEPTPGLLEVILVFIFEAEQDAKEEGERSLEWAIVGERRSKNDEKIEEETEACEGDGDCGDCVVDGEEVDRDGVTEEEKSGL